MADPFATIDFPGVESPIRISGAYSLGTSPSVFMLYMHPQDAQISEIGDLIVQFGSRVLRLRDCKADYSRPVYGTEGHEVEVPIFDRRWKWKFAEISGSYNRRVPQPDGSEVVNAQNLRTPQELAAMLLDAMGESGYDVSKLPNDVYPPVSWDRDPADAELEKLVGSLGCAIAPPDIVTNRVRIVKLGDGPDLPDDIDLANAQLTFNSAERPDFVKVLCDETLVQARLRLEAVGLDTDDRVKPVDSLDYTPDNGWGAEPFTMPNVLANYGRKAWELAQQTVFRWFRPRFDVPDDWIIVPLPGFGDFAVVVDNVDMIQLVDFRLEAFKTGSSHKRKPAEVYGDWWIGNTGDPLNTSDVDTSNRYTRYIRPGTTDDRGFSIDSAAGLVKFSEQVLLVDGTASSGYSYGAPDLWLECAFSMRDVDRNGTGSWAPSRYEYALSLGPPLNSGAEIARRPGLRLEIVESVDESVLNGNRGSEYTNNLDDIQGELEHVAEYEALKWASHIAGDASYNGLAVVTPNGTWRQVAWKIDEGGGVDTMISLNTETYPYVPPYTKRVSGTRVRGSENVSPGEADKTRRLTRARGDE